MTRAPDWTIEEFRVLMSRPELGSDGFATLLPNRTAGAIDSVRAGIHKFHLGQHEDFLSAVMREHLDSARGTNECPICGERV